MAKILADQKSHKINNKRQDYKYNSGTSFFNPKVLVLCLIFGIIYFKVLEESINYSKKLLAKKSVPEVWRR